jgi:hypothetical protein
MNESKQCQNGCLCGGCGPALTKALEALLPTGAAGEHFKRARVEFLKGVRELVDQRIQAMETTPQTKGAKLSVD